MQQEESERNQFAVHDVFYIAPPVDSVIATGVVEFGTFQVGDRIRIGDSIKSTIGKIESPKQADIAEAAAGDNVEFHLIGVDRGQVKAGDKIVSRD